MRVHLCLGLLVCALVGCASEEQNVEDGGALGESGNPASELVDGAPLMTQASLNDSGVMHQLQPTSDAAPIALQPDPGTLFEPEVDDSVSPCVDFYRYACTNWMKPHQGKSVFNRILEADEKNKTFLRDKLEQYRRGEHLDEPNARALAAFYASCMDEAAIEQLGLTPFDDMLREIRALTDTHQTLGVLGKLFVAGRPVLLRVSAQVDPQDGQQMIVQLASGMLEPRFFFEDQSELVALVRTKYIANMARNFTLAGLDPLRVPAVFAMLDKLAHSTISTLDAREPTNYTNRMTQQQLAEQYPQLDWLSFLRSIGVPEGVPVNVQEPAYLRTLIELASARSAGDWQALLAWQVLKAAQGWLPAAYRDEDLLGQLLGSPPPADRSQYCARETQAQLGDLLGFTYARERFDARSEQRVHVLLGGLRSALELSLREAPHLVDEATRKQALHKLQKMSEQVGAPKTAPTVSVSFHPKAFSKNSLELTKQRIRDAFQLLGKSRDNSRWHLGAAEVNAGYQPDYNRVVIPAGILQPPFFDAQRENAFNFAAVGMILGHELTHGFDDQGARYDADGALRDWWSSASTAAFDERAQCLVEQFDGYPAVASKPQGKHLSGELTLGENIADLGGLRGAYRAFQASQQEFTPPTSTEFTPDQRFFIAFAQMWCYVLDDTLAELSAVYDVHAPDGMRVNGVVPNMPEFAAAFDCKPGSPMVHSPELMCKVW